MVVFLYGICYKHESVCFCVCACADMRLLLWVSCGVLKRLGRDGGRRSLLKGQVYYTESLNNCRFILHIHIIPILTCSNEGGEMAS